MTLLAAGAVQLVMPGTAGAQDGAPVTSTTVPPNVGGAAGDRYHLWPAMAILGVALLVICAALWFAYAYHRRVLETLERLGKGQPVTTDPGSALGASAGQAGVLARTADDPLAVTGPDAAVVGQAVTFEAVNAGDPSSLSWTVEGASPKPSLGSGASITLGFGAAGSAAVVATEPGADGAPPRFSQPWTVTVTAPAPASAAAPGIVLPFVIKNWGRLVVTLLGIGVIAAMMTMGVIESDAGIAVLGTLLGVGAASAQSERTVGDPPAPPAAAPAPPPGDSPTKG